MLFSSSKYTGRFIQNSILSIVFTVLSAATLHAQTVVVKHNATTFELNPLLRASFKKPIKAAPLLAEYIKPGKHELMYWPNFPLNAAQIEARNRAWERKNKQTIGEQVAGDIIKGYVNSLIYGKKPVAVAPKF